MNEFSPLNLYIYKIYKKQTSKWKIEAPVIKSGMRKLLRCEKFPRKKWGKIEKNEKCIRLGNEIKFSEVYKLKTNEIDYIDALAVWPFIFAWYIYICGLMRTTKAFFLEASFPKTRKHTKKNPIIVIEFREFFDVKDSHLK